MFGKLVKYELKAAGKWYFLLYGSVLVVATILGLFIKSASKESYDIDFVALNGTMGFLLSMVFFALITGTFIATLFLIVARFNKNIYGREGYLTLTLPVSTHAVIWSKILTSSLWIFLNWMVLAFSLGLLALPSFGLGQLLAALPRLRPFLMTSQAGLLALFFIISAITSILTIYLAISIGQLFQDRRGLLGFVAYFTINVIWSVSSYILSTTIFENTANFNSISYLIFLILEYLVVSALFYVAVHHILKNKLNIQ